MPKSISTALKPVYALVGSDPLLQNEALRHLQSQAPPDMQRADIDGAVALLADVLDEVRSFAMFGGSKMVVVRDADEFISRFRPQMEDYVAAPVDSAILVLRCQSLPSTQRIAKAIARTGEIVKCEPPKLIDQWIIQRGKSQHGITVDSSAARLLEDLIGADLSRLDNELAKLALMCRSGRVSEDDIAQSVAFQRERQMWDFTNALGAGNTDEALRRWRQLVQGDKSAEFRAITWLAIWLENVRKAMQMLKRGDNVGNIASALRIWPRDAVDPFMRTVKALGPHGLVQAVDLLAKIDYQTKTGVGDAVDNVERFILTLAANR